MTAITSPETELDEATEALRRPPGSPRAGCSPSSC